MSRARKEKSRKTKSTKSRGKALKVVRRQATLERVNLHAAGIDVGSTSMFVAVPPESSAEVVKEYGVTTPELHALADWLKECGVTAVAMESTGVYWIPVYEVLEARGFEVSLVDARKAQNVSGKKTDVLDCQWLQELHTYGLLAKSFRPADEIVVLRSYLRQREMLVESRASHVQHIHKALQQMNLRLDTVVSDVTGETGMSILKAILGGERDGAKLSSLRNFRCHASEEEIAEALDGNYREEHLFSLKQAVKLVESYDDRKAECETEIERYVSSLQPVTEEEMPEPPERKRSLFSFDVREHLYRQLGTDVMRIKGINAEVALVIYSETGRDLETDFGNGKRYSSWMGLSPNTKKTGGRVISSKTRQNGSRAAAAFRQAAVSVGRSDTSLGAYYRRIAAKLGKGAAVTATAHKLARIWFALVTKRELYDESGAAAYEEKQRERVLKGLSKKAQSLGYELRKVAA